MISSPMPGLKVLSSSIAACCVALNFAVSPLAAQWLPPDHDRGGPVRPSFALTAGVGNVQGWFGVSGERFFLDGRASAVAGIGTAWFSQDVSPSAAFGTAVRGYLGDGSRQLLLELSASLISIRRTHVNGIPGDYRRYYGPGVTAGYRHTSDRGFHYIAGAGAGWAVGARTLEPTLILAAGYTWRR